MKLIMTKGLPGSGKSTWAKEQLKKGNCKRINKDDLRRMLDNGKWSGPNEKYVVNMRNILITNALEIGYNVIVDDTNLHPKHEIFLRDLAKQLQHTFEVKDFTDVPIELCIKRDLMRLESVGEAVIRKMYKDFLAPKVEPPVWNPKLSDVIICDLDGTLALFGSENPYNRPFIRDQLNKPVSDTITQMANYYDIIMLSGREGKFREETEKWLEMHSINYSALHMRAEGDVRKDFIIKEELYREHIEDKYNVLYVLDDRNQVVDLWRRLGLVCFQVAEGNF